MSSNPFKADGYSTNLGASLAALNLRSSPGGTATGNSTHESTENDTPTESNLHDQSRDNKAKQYWGDLVVDRRLAPCGMSPRLNCLVVSMCDLAYAISDVRPPAINLKNAEFYLMPETFAMIIQMLEIKEPTFGPEEHIETFGPSLFDDIFAAYYKWFGLEIKWTTRPGSGRENGLPLINRRAVKHWLRNYIGSSPDQFYDRLNGLLAEIQELRDPVTDLPYEEKSIPRACFPAGPVESTNDSIKASYAGFTKASLEIFDRAQPLLETEEEARQDYLDTIQQARMLKEYNRDINGGWKIDEDGREVYVGSCLW